jgi:hypothetical protein
MPNQILHTADEVAAKLGISKPRLSQLVNGYTNRLGNGVEPELKEGTHYVWERRTVQGPKRKVTRHVILFTEAGLERIKEVASGSPGRPRKSPSK